MKDLSPILAFVKEELSFDHSGHDFLHAKRVAKNAEIIQKTEGGDLELILVSSYLHDCVDHKLFANQEPQYQKIRDLLASLGYQKEFILKVEDILSSISWNHGKEKELSLLEAQIVRDADRLDAIGAIGLVRCIEYGASHQRNFYVEEEVLSPNKGGRDTSLSHIYEKLLKLPSHMLTTKGKEMAKEREAFLLSFLEQFQREITD